MDARPDMFERLYAQARNPGLGNPALEWRWAQIFQIIGNADELRVVDIGSGDGSFLQRLAARFPTATIAGVEPSTAGIQRARQSLPGARFVQADLTDNDPPELRELSAFANVAICTEVLEHLADPIAGLRNARRLMRPGATLIVTVPGGPMSTLDHQGGHYKHYSRRELRRELTDAGFEVRRVSALGFPFLNLYRLALILRGARAAADQERLSNEPPKGAVRFAFFAFQFLFRFNFPTPWGWQIVATAIRP